MKNAHGILIGRAQLLWASVRDSLWFAPAVAVATAIVLAIFAVRAPTPSVGNRMAEVWLFGAGVDGAREMLSAIAASLITVTGVVFSVTIIALQLASSQFTPRVLRSFVGDRTNQVVLAIFIGTFTYSLLVLRTIQSESEERDNFIPQVAVLLAMVLLLVSIGALIVFVNHSAKSIQASVILERETALTLARIRHIFPDELSEPEWEQVEQPELPSTPGIPIAAADAGYLQMVGAETLDELADDHSLTIRMDVRVGGFVVAGQPLATVWPVSELDDEVRDGIREAFLLGPERTPEQDVEYGIIEIADIAVRALSPGVNDPTTAMLCIDRMSEILVTLGRRRAPAPVRDTTDGALRFVALHTTFERAAGLAFDQIRHHGATNPAVLGKLLNAIGILLPLVPAGDRQALLEQVDAIATSASIGISHPDDRARIEALMAETRRVGAEVR